MDNISKATSLQDFIGEVTPENHVEHRTDDYKLVFWNGKERVPLVIEGIDHNDKVIVFGDVRRWEGV